jgi:hypothetical protein
MARHLQTFNWTVLSASLCLQAGRFTRSPFWLALVVLWPLSGAWLGAGLSRIERQEFQ